MILGFKASPSFFLSEGKEAVLLDKAKLYIYHFKAYLSFSLSFYPFVDARLPGMTPKCRVWSPKVSGMVF